MNPKIQEILACPYCNTFLDKKPNQFICEQCKSTYPISNRGVPDLRLMREKPHSHEFILGRALLPSAGFDFSPLPENPLPEVNFSNEKVPFHLSKEILSYFPKSKTSDEVALDLGCGNAVHKDVCEFSGFNYLGVDYNNTQAPVLGDAHALPIADNSISFVLSIAMLEHIQHPVIALKEAYRVLKPGGKLVGTVAFLEPFHGNSYYHHTHLGTYNSLQQAGFDIEYVCPSTEWTVLFAQASMGLFPKMPTSLSKLLAWPMYLAHRVWWKVGGIVDARASENERLLKSTGAYTFIATKTLSQ